MQGKHVLKTLEIVEDVFIRGENITQKEACEETTKVLLSDISSQTIERWFIIHKNNNYKFVLSKQGRSTIYKDFNPFRMLECEGKSTRDNEDIYNELRQWGIENLETLILPIMQKKINDLLEEPVKNDPAFAVNYRLLCYLYVQYLSDDG